MRYKRRKSKLTRGIYCEGEEDHALLTHLSRLYGSEYIHINIRHGNGKEQRYLVEKAGKILTENDEKFILLDSDKPAMEMERAEILAKQLQIRVLRSRPKCLEGMLLAILGHDSLHGLNSSQMKKKFEDEYIPHKHRLEIEKYKKILPKTLLEKRRKEMPELDSLIRIFEDKNFK